MKYIVNVDRGVEYDPLTGRVMDLRGESGPPFEHKACGVVMEVKDIPSAEVLVKKGFLLPVAERRTEERFRVEK